MELNTRKLKSFRGIALITIAIGLTTSVTLQIVIGENIVELVARYLSSLAFFYFLYTEAFLFTVPERSILNIRLAKVFFAFYAISAYLFITNTLSL